MKLIFIFTGIFMHLLHCNVLTVQAAALICPDSDADIIAKPDHKVHLELYNDNEEVREANKNSLNKLFHSIQCTLEKAKPWVADLQQEAKRLEEAAKILSLGIVNAFGEFVDKLVEDSTELSINVEHNSTAISDVTTSDTSNEISDYLCPEGFIADHNGICERIE